MGLLVPAQRKRGGLVSLQRVAALASIKVGSRRELPIVLILMAISTELKLDLEKRVFAFGDMTLGAFHAEVLPFERIGRGGVKFCRKRRRLEALHCVTGCALRASGPLGELAVVRVGLVTVHALRECDRLLKISSRVA